MSVSSASAHSRLGSYRTSDNSDYQPRFYSSRSPSLDNGFTSGGTLSRRYSPTSSSVRPLPVGPSIITSSQYDSTSPSSSLANQATYVRSVPLRYNDITSTNTGTLGRRTTASISASSKPPLPSSAYDRVSSSLGNSKYLSSHSPDLRHHNIGINRYIRSSSTERSPAPTTIYPRHNMVADDQYRRLPVTLSTDLEYTTRPYSAASALRQLVITHDDHKRLLSSVTPTPLSSSHGNYLNGTSTTRTVPIYYDRDHYDEARDVLASLMTSPSASSGIGTSVSSGSAGGSLSNTGLYRSRVGAVSVPDVPTYARGYADETGGGTSTNNGYSSGSRRSSLTNNTLERQELEDDDEESPEDKEARDIAELRRLYSPSSVYSPHYRRRSSENDNWAASGQAASSEADHLTTGKHLNSTTTNNSVGNGTSNAFVKNEPNRSSTSSAESSESYRLSSGRSSDGGTNSRYGDSGRYIRDDDNNDSKKSGLAGLRNLGNTCFMNSVIQCLSNTRPLRDYCLQSSSTLSTDINNNTTSRMKGALIKAFRELLSELWSTTKGGYVSPDRFKTQIQKFAPRFTGYSQQDAQEFLRYLLQGLHEDINRVQTRPPALPPIEDSLPDAQKAMESWKRYLRVDESKVVDIFVGQLKSELKCTHCGNVSTTFDPFWDLSLPIPQESRRNQVTLSDCLDTFTKEEVLDGDEKPTCDVCKTRRRCTKKFSIQKFPSVLVLHLKRFSGERYRSRLSTLVDFPLTKLDLSPYAAVKSAVTPTYDLYAVSNHSGTPMTGHYTAYSKNTQSGRWFLYDDTRVTGCNERSVVSAEAYVLFYELSSTGSSSRL